MSSGARISGYLERVRTKGEIKPDVFPDDPTINAIVTAIKNDTETVEHTSFQDLQTLTLWEVVDMSSSVRTIRNHFRKKLERDPTMRIHTVWPVVSITQSKQYYVQVLVLYSHPTLK